MMRFYPNPSGEWKSSHGPIQVIDFSQLEKLNDNYAAFGCICVATSNGKIGTITHLATSELERVDEFVTSLDNVLKGNKESTKVILSGGSNLEESQMLSQKIIACLKAHQYQIAGQYLDHATATPIPKITTLERDKVIIKESLPKLKKEQFTEIDFQGNNKTYTKEQELPDFVKALNNKLNQR